MIIARENCPFCDNPANLEREVREINYRGESFRVSALFYSCGDCGETYTTTQLDTLTMGQVYDRYRSKHGIPFPEDMVRIREKYGLSARKMSEVLGLGINGYNNYENGEMPTQAMANLIMTAHDPDVFAQLAGNVRDSFSGPAWAKLQRRIAEAQEVDLSPGAQRSLGIAEEPPGEFNGFVRLSPDRIRQLFIFFLKNAALEYNDRLKLNKLLFYSDFFHFKNSGRSITGLSYRAIPYGPVPSSYDRIFTWLEQEGLIQVSWDNVQSGAGRERFTTGADPDDSIFSESEQEVIRVVLDRFGALPSWELVEISHQEHAWLELNADRKLISYPDYAFSLKAL